MAWDDQNTTDLHASHWWWLRFNKECAWSILGNIDSCKSMSFLNLDLSIEYAIHSLDSTQLHGCWTKNRGTPKSSILMRFSITNHPFWGTPVWKHPHHFWCVFVTLQFGAPTIFIIALTCKRLPLISIDVLPREPGSNDQVRKTRAVEDECGVSGKNRNILHWTMIAGALCFVFFIRNQNHMSYLWSSPQL